MSLNLYNQAGVVPNGTSLPGNAQALVTFIAQYLLIAGGQNFNGINFGSVTPSPDNRDKPWWRTDSTGNPLGMYSWSGTAWVTTPFIIPNGPSTSRPLNPSNYTEYFDTTINRLLIYERGQWRTADGCTGEVREVKAVTIAAAIALNPGWIEDADSIGRVIGSAGVASGVASHAYGELAGAESLSLTINNIPAHTHDMVYANAKADGNSNNIDQGLMWHNAAGTAGSNTTASSSVGANPVSAISILQPTIFYWRICKT